MAVAAAFFAARDQANEAQKQRLRAEDGERKNRELVAESRAEAGRQFIIDHRYQEAVPYFWMRANAARTARRFA